MENCDIVVLGAGPYGLAAATHLKNVKGLAVRIFGEPMSFWERNMPVGMFLRSNWTATQIADPQLALTLEVYGSESGSNVSQPVPLDRFVQYGHWYQQKGVPDLDRRGVFRVERGPDGFRTTLSDGEVLGSRRVVVAAGIGSFAWRPPEFDGLPVELASHTSEHPDLGKFSGKKVLVVGGGQSALESAALLHEGGAEAEVIARTRTIHWLQGSLSRTLHHGLGKYVRSILYAPTDVGPAGISRLMARPDLLRRLPRSVQDKLRKRAVRPAGARWLVDRLKSVPVRLGCSVADVATAGLRVRVRLSDGSERTVDHVLLGTGYRVNVAKYDFLSPELVQSVRRCNGYPCLEQGLETSVPGLHILGAPAAWSFGPLMQFVSGARYAAQALTRRVVANK
jgi:cation diffusion facilitator CzcD-associated flavoprotein CzcO